MIGQVLYRQGVADIRCYGKCVTALPFDRLGNYPNAIFGYIREYKGLDVLIDAASAIDGRIVVVGHGPMRRRWDRLAAGSPAAPRIRFAGQVPDEDLPFYYAAADVVVLPSSHRSEAFGQVLLEAMGHEATVADLVEKAISPEHPENLWATAFLAVFWRLAKEKYIEEWV